jgi:stress response protein YsnF
MPEPEVLPVVEEIVSVETRPVRTGRVRIETVTEAVEDIARAELGVSDVEVTRVPVDREIETVPEIRTEGDVTIVPVVEEVLVVTKRLVLKEEVHITRRRSSQAVEVPVTLRRQRAIVTREGREDQHDGDTENV